MRKYKHAAAAAAAGWESKGNETQRENSLTHKN